MGRITLPLMTQIFVGKQYQGTSINSRLPTLTDNGKYGSCCWGRIEFATKLLIFSTRLDVSTTYKLWPLSALLVQSFCSAGVKELASSEIAKITA